MKNRIACLGLLLALIVPVKTFAGVTMFVSPSGDGSFIIEGDNSQGMQAIDIAIGYDTASLANPRLEAQGATLTDVSADTPGVVTATILKNPDSGFELNLKFDKKGNLPGRINYVTATAVDKDGKNYDASSDLRALTTPPPSPPAPPEEKAAAGPAAPAATVVRDSGVEVKSGSVPGGDTETGAAPLAQGEAPKGETAAMEARTAGDGAMEAGKKSSARTEGVAPANDAVAAGVTRHKSVLQLFGEFTGKKELKAFAALFERHEPRMVQEPVIALSDGKTPVRIRLDPEPATVSPPHVSLSEAKLVSLRKEGDKGWIVTAVPDKGTWKACLTVRAGGSTTEFPLVVVPPVAVPKETTEKTFTAALEAYASAQAPCCEWGGEQCRRYFHEYVFTANYLAKSMGKSKETEGSKKR